MKKTVTLVIALFAIFQAFAQEQTGTKWLDLSFKEALTEAGKQNKPVFLDCYTKTCAPCKYYEKEIFPIKEIGDYLNANFICIKKDLEEGEGVEIAKKYNVMLFPTFLVLDGEGNELFRLPMLLDPQKDLEPTLELSLKMVEDEKQYKDGNRDPQFIKEFFENQKTLNQMEYEKMLGEYLYNEKKDSLTQASYWQMFKDEIHNIELPLFRYVLENRDEFAEIYGREEVYGKLFWEYTNEFRMARQMGLNYDIRISDVKIFEEEGFEEATPLIWRMEIHDLWNSSKGNKGDITDYLKRLDKVLYEFDTKTQMEIANDFALLSEVTTPEQSEEMSNMLEKLKSCIDNERHIKRLGELQRYFKR